MVVNFIFDFFAIKYLSGQERYYQLHAKKTDGSVGWSAKLFVFIYFFLTGDNKVNLELKCPSISQLMREKLNTRKNNDTII